MIPKIIDISEDFRSDFETNVNLSDYTYKINNNRVKGWIDEQESIKQSIYKVLNTERYDHVIYSSNYGIEFKDLIGQHVAYVMAESERRIRDALLFDDRIIQVYDFEFNVNKQVIELTFKCDTIFGRIIIDTGVNF